LQIIPYEQKFSLEKYSDDEQQINKQNNNTPKEEIGRDVEKKLGKNINEENWL
jgi:hypothetical protein